MALTPLGGLHGFAVPNTVTVTVQLCVTLADQFEAVTAASKWLG
jgi:hypothetical protein